MLEITDELNIDKDTELVWGLKYYGRCFRSSDSSDLGPGALMLRAAERIKELNNGKINE